VVYIVGAGIGDPELLTLKAKKRIEEAQVILYDALIDPDILSYAAPGCRLIYTGKRARRHSRAQEEINELLVKYGREYNTVRLKGGDPFVFGRGAEEIEALIENGIEYELVPGISSSYAAAEYAGIPVTLRGCASSFHVITAHGAENMPDYPALARLSGTLVFLMGLSEAGKISAELIKNGKSPDTAAAIISNASLPTQRTETGSLAKLSEMADRVKPPAVIIVGDAAEICYDWYKPSGVRIIATGTQSLNRKIKEAFGDVPVTEIPLIRINKTGFDDFSATDLSEFSHIAFTSSVGVEVFFEYMRRIGRDIRRLAKIEFAVVGKGTAAALAERGIIADIVPEVQNSEALAEMLADSGKTLVVRAGNGSDAIKRVLGERAYELLIYETEADMSKRELLNIALKEADYLILASGSAARAYAAMAESETKLVAIGKETAREAREAGLDVYGTARAADAWGIAEFILEDMRK